jgi:glyoxylase-like metal-dependent hydrolase (beta-lactamase superfamily II)
MAAMPEEYRIGQVATDVWSVAIPRPHGGVPSKVYVLRCSSGYVLVDAGWSTAAGVGPLTAALATVGIELGDVRGVALTHLHIDHCGLADAIRSVTGAWLAAHPAEVESAAYRHGAASPFVVDLERWLRDAGVPTGEADQLLAARDASNAAAPVFAVDTLLANGASVDAPGWSLTALHTPGHSPGHLCFLDQERRLLFGGDLILEGRVPPVWCYDFEHGGDPIADYLASVDSVAPLAGTVLPGHGAPFTGAPNEAERLRDHHERRMSWLAEHLAPRPATVWEAALAAPWSRAWAELPLLARLLALGKISAHLVALDRLGVVRRIDDRAPARFAVVPSPATIAEARL